MSLPYRIRQYQAHHPDATAEELSEALCLSVGIVKEALSSMARRQRKRALIEQPPPEPATARQALAAQGRAVWDFLLGQPTASNAVVREATRASWRTIAQVRQMLVAQRLVPVSEQDYRSAASRTRQARQRGATPTTGAVTGRGLTPPAPSFPAAEPPGDRYHGVLDEIATDPEAAANARIAAIGKLHQIQKSPAEQRALGPGPPLTEEEKIERVARILRTQTLAVIRAAIPRALTERYILAEQGET